MGTRLKFALGLAAATVLAGAGTALAGSMTGGSNYSLWSGKDAPNTPADPDGQPVELGLKFTADRAGTVTGVRFYKSSANTGTHTGSLWSDSGQRLATVTFTGESASGWQSATFAQPVPVAPGRTYVVSYHTDTGHYADDEGYFAAPRTRGPLRAPA